MMTFACLLLQFKSLHTSSFGSQPCHKWSCKTCHPPTPTFCEAGRPQPRCTPHFSEKKERKLMPRWKNALIKRTEPTSAIYCRIKTSLIFSRWVWMKTICALCFNRKFADFEVWSAITSVSSCEIARNFFLVKFWQSVCNTSQFDDIFK